MLVGMKVGIASAAELTKTVSASRATKVSGCDRRARRISDSARRPYR